MSLKPIVATLDDLPDDIKKLYRKREDGKYALDVEGLVEREKLDEFRSNNVSLKEEIEKLRQQMEAFKGIDPAKYKELLAKMQTDEEKKLLEAGKIEEVVTQRTARMRAEFQEQLQAKDKLIVKLEGDVNKAYQERATHIIDSELRRAVDNPELGFQPGVADLLKEQVLKEFVYRDGKVVRVKPDGNLVYGKGGDPGSLHEFLQDIIKERPYLVKASNGGGAPPRGGGQNGSGKTMKRVDFEQASPQARMDFTKSGGVVID
jgi:hypothetical protein